MPGLIGLLIEEADDGLHIRGSFESVTIGQIMASVQVLADYIVSELQKRGDSRLLGLARMVQVGTGLYPTGVVIGEREGELWDLDSR